jgi:transposase
LHIIFLSSPERDALKAYSQDCLIKGIRLKAQAVLLRNQGMSVTDIASVLFKTERTVSGWLQSFITRRISSLMNKKMNNQNAAKLTKEQKLEIKKVVGEPPDEYGIPKEFWDVPKLKEYIKSEFGVVYESDASYHFLLQFCNLSFKYPDLRSPRRDENAIKKRQREIRREIKPLLKDEQWIVFASDETRLQKEAEIRRAWLVKGKRTIVKTERSKEHQNYLGFLDQRTHVCQVFPIKRGNSVETIRVLKKLVKQYPDKRICIVWDNARWHKSKQLREELSTGKSLQNIHLIALEPYAPETNPIEHVWGYAKGRLANKSGRDFEDIKQEFIQLTHQRAFLHQI